MQHNGTPAGKSGTSAGGTSGTSAPAAKAERGSLADAIVRLRGQDATLVKLSLRHKNLGDAGTRALAGAVAGNGTLKTLDLTGNGVGDAGAAALAGALPPAVGLSSSEQ